MSHILQGSSPIGRAKFIEHAITLATAFLQAQNLYGVLMVFTALTDSAVSRLKLSWEKIDKKKRKVSIDVNLGFGCSCLTSSFFSFSSRK